MKIGIISDIHADLTSLKKALAIFDTEQVDQIICAGDLVEKGKDGNAVVSLIRDRKIPCVMGNHDQMAPINQAWIRRNMDLNHPQVQSILLSDDTLTYLKQLPLELRFEWAGLNILIVHGTPNNNREYLWDMLPVETLCDYANKASANILIHGHTHLPTFFRASETYFLNPGSVKDEDTRSSCTCCILNLPELHINLFSLKDGSYSEQVVEIIA